MLALMTNRCGGRASTRWVSARSRPDPRCGVLQLSNCGAGGTACWSTGTSWCCRPRPYLRRKIMSEAQSAYLEPCGPTSCIPPPAPRVVPPPSMPPRRPCAASPADPGVEFAPLPSRHSWRLSCCPHVSHLGSVRVPSCSGRLPVRAPMPRVPAHRRRRHRLRAGGVSHCVFHLPTSLPLIPHQHVC